MQVSLAYDKLTTTHNTVYLQGCWVGGCNWFGHLYACYTVKDVPAIGPLLAMLYCCL